MAAYLVVSYDISDPEQFARYNAEGLPVVMESFAKHGGKILAASNDDSWMAGERQMVGIFEFPSVEAAQAFDNDPNRAAAKEIHLAATTNRIEVIVPGFAPSGAGKTISAEVVKADAEPESEPVVNESYVSEFVSEFVREAIAKVNAKADSHSNIEPTELPPNFASAIKP